MGAVEIIPTVSTAAQSEVFLALDLYFNVKLTCRK